MSWREDVGGVVEGLLPATSSTPANPTFVLDESDVPLTPTAQADVREPISSSCIATPFNSDGAACQGGALGTPFFLFTNGTSPRGLFADAYQPDTPVTGAASGVSSSSATRERHGQPRGRLGEGVVPVRHDDRLRPGDRRRRRPALSNAATPFAAQLTGLPAGTTIHYRAVAVSDFGTFVGADQTLTTASTPPAPGAADRRSATRTSSAAKVSGSTASVRVSCTGPAGATCRLALKLTVTETLKGHKLVAVTARANGRKTRRVVVVGTANVSLKAGQTQTVRIALNRTGKRLLASRHGLKAKLGVSQATGSRRHHNGLNPDRHVQTSQAGPRTPGPLKATCPSPVLDQEDGARVHVYRAARCCQDSRTSRERSGRSADTGRSTGGTPSYR